MHRAAELNITVTLKPCHDCGYELCDRDRYCRRCGVRQPEQSPLPTLRFASHETARAVPAYRSFSGPLIQTITSGVAVNTTARLQNRAAKSLISALISLPIWLLIVMLSPIEAWAATRAATTQM